MSRDINRIILDELRAHRAETQAGFEKINGRVRSLEESRAESRGSIKTAIGISSLFSSAIAFFVSHFYHN